MSYADARLGDSSGDQAGFVFRRWPREFLSRSQHYLLVVDELGADLEHLIEIDWPITSHGVAQRVVGDDHLKAGRLAVVPLGAIVGSVWADHTVSRSDLVPQQRLRRAGLSDALHVDGQTIRVQRFELVDEAANAECGRPVGRPHAGLRQP